MDLDLYTRINKALFELFPETTQAVMPPEPKRKALTNLYPSGVKKQKVVRPLEARWWCDCGDNLSFGVLLRSDRHNPGRIEPVEAVHHVAHAFLSLNIPGLSSYTQKRGLKLVSRKAEDCLERKHYWKLVEEERRQLIEQRREAEERARARVAFLSLKVLGLDLYIKEHGLRTIDCREVEYDPARLIHVRRAKSFQSRWEWQWQNLNRDERPMSAAIDPEKHTGPSAIDAGKTHPSPNKALSLKLNVGRSSICAALHEALKDVKRARKRDRAAKRALADARSRLETGIAALQIAEDVTALDCKMLSLGRPPEERSAMRKKVAMSVDEEERAYNELEEAGRAVNEALRKMHSSEEDVYEAQAYVRELRLQISGSEGMRK